MLIANNHLTTAMKLSMYVQSSKQMYQSSMYVRVGPCGPPINGSTGGPLRPCTVQCPTFFDLQESCSPSKSSRVHKSKTISSGLIISSLSGGSNLICISQTQTGFPKQYKLLPVKMYALRPKKWTLLIVYFTLVFPEMNQSIPETGAGDKLGYVSRHCFFSNEREARGIV